MNNNLPNQINYLPISEAAKFLGVSQDTLRRWDKTGVIKSKRLDGKNRYFALGDLKKNISSRPLSISEVSKKFNISSTTLRRLEARGLIKPLRSKAGVRGFDSATIEAFIKSSYYQRKQLSLKKPKTVSKKAHILKLAPPSTETQPKKKEATNQASDQAPKLDLNHFLAMSSASFILLVVVGLGNVFLFKTQNYEMLPLPMVLGEKFTAPLEAPVSQSIEPEETSSIQTQQVQIEEPKSPLEKYIAESLEMANDKKQQRLLASNFLRLVEIASPSATIDIRREPNYLSPVVGTALGGEVFEFMSFDTGWIQLKLHESTQSGYIQEKYATVKEFEFSTPESAWNDLSESSGSGLPQGPFITYEEKEADDQNIN